MISKIRRFRGLNSILPSLIASLVVVVLMKLNVWTAFERSVNNHMMVWRGTSAWDSRIVMVSIDNKTLDAYGQFPISRDHYADLLLKLTKEEVSTVAFSVLFADSSAASIAPKNSTINARLASAMATLGTVVIGQTWDDEGKATPPVPVLANTAIAVGHLQLNADSDGITRRVPILWDGVPALGVATVQAYSLQNELISIPSDLQELRINWASSATDLATLSLIDVVNGQYPPDFFKGKIVIVSYGATASGSQLRTPYDNRTAVPGGYLHAAVIDTLLKQEWLHPVSTDSVLLLLMIGGTSFGLLLYRRRVWTQLALGAAACLGWLALCMVALSYNYLLPVVSPLVTLALVGGAIAILSRLQANALLQVRSAFLSTMSHEIRTPLNAIVNLSEMLQETQLDTRQREFAETLNNSSQALLALINDVLDFSKIESGRLMIEQYPVCLSDIVERCLEMLAPKAAEKGLELVYSIAPNTPAVVMSDPVRLQQILLNLLSNAIKFTETGEISVQVQATLINQNQSLFSWGSIRQLLVQGRLRQTPQGVTPGGAPGGAQGLFSRAAQPFTTDESGAMLASGSRPAGLPARLESAPLDSTSKQRGGLARSGSVYGPANDDLFNSQSISVRQPPVGRLYEIRFAVHDTGIGIPQDRLNQLFRPFSQVSVTTTRKYGGTGLGLSISKRLTERMGGDLWVRSYPGEGSTFYFTVQAHLAEATKPYPSYLSGLSGTRLLLIDSNLTRRNQLTWELQPIGIRLAQATSLSEALTFMQNDPTFDGIILDESIAHSREDCVATVQTLRQTARNETLPVILLSTLQPHAYQPSASEQVSSSTVVWKPVKQSAIHQALRSIQPMTLPVPAELPPQGRFPTLSAGSPLTPSGAETANQANPPGLTQEDKQRASLSILIAEDNKVNQRVALRLLELLGYRADIVSSGAEVLTALKRQRYDVVLMDMRMPELDGVDATRQIRQMPQYARIWIIAMTANAMSRDRQRCFAAGMDDYLSKPINRDALDQALQRCLQGQRHDATQ